MHRAFTRCFPVARLQLITGDSIVPFRLMSMADMMSRPCMMLHMSSEKIYGSRIISLIDILADVLPGEEKARTNLSLRTRSEGRTQKGMWHLTVRLHFPSLRLIDK